MNTIQVNLARNGRSPVGQPAVLVDGVEMYCTGLEVVARCGSVVDVVLHMSAPVLMMNLEAEAVRRVESGTFGGVLFIDAQIEKRKAQMRRFLWSKAYDAAAARREVA